MNFKKISFLLLCVVLLSGMTGLNAQNKSEKPRVIVMTDGEIDDRSSMIRFLLYTCDVEVCAIIQTNSVFQRNGWSSDFWIEEQIDAYEKVYPNLKIHNPSYPTADYLRSVLYVGDEDEENLKKYPEKNLVWTGKEVLYIPDNSPDTPGSDKIVEVLLQEDNRPVHIQAWGGGNTAARAFYKLKSEHPSEYDSAMAKVIMYNIWYQDGAGNYIEQYHPKVKMLFCGSFEGTWAYNSQKNTYDFIENEVKNNHGPLGALYPQDYVSEGDSPAFLYSIANGLRNHEHPTYGGWGGRFTKTENFKNVYIDARDDGDKRKSLRRWIQDANADFQARMDWCVSSSYDGANHPPIVQIKGKMDITVKSGKKVNLDASRTFDPDGDSLFFKWWQYKDAGSYPAMVELKNTDSDRVSFTAPKVSKPETIHIILEVSDNGSPSLKGYQRVIITAVP